MKNTKIITAIISGLSIYGGCMAGTLAKIPPLVLLFAYLLPGLIFGMVLTSHVIINRKRDLIMIIVSVALYCLVIYIVDPSDRIALLDLPAKIIVASIIGAISLSVAYDVLIVKEIRWMQTFVWPALIGIVTSMISAFSAYKLELLNYDENEIKVLYQFGFYSIFPIWQILFVLSKESSFRIRR